MAWFKKDDKASGKKKRVLAIDDENSFTTALKINLEGMGDFEVETVNDPQRALMVAREFRPDVILLDVVMPDMDGGDVKAKFASDSELSQVPVIMITALVSEQETSREAVVESGHNVMLGKPLKVAKLIECIEQVLAGDM